MTGSLVVMEHITKTFPGVNALDNAHFELRAGEVHALLGENGAGKSTMMKILVGIYHMDSGEMTLNGEPLAVSGPKDAQEKGISIIHQELNLMTDLTVSENIWIGREPRARIPFTISKKAELKMTEELLARLHIRLDPKAKVADLSVAQQQMVEIAKALSFNSKVLIMDEPTATLTDREIDELFRMVRDLRDQGVGIVHISHRLEEIQQIADRVTVMRDGKTIETMKASDTTIDEIIRLMVGRTIFQEAPVIPDTRDQEVLLEVKNLNRGRQVRDVSFTLRRGEVLGFAGLVGAGRTEVLRTVFGADRAESGEIYVRGKKARVTNPRRAVKNGIGYLSEDRKRFGLAVGMDVQTNVSLAVLPRLTDRIGQLNFKKVRSIAEDYVDTLRIKTPSVDQLVQFLSGGNQQKVAIAKWLNADTDIIIFDEPTRGIDVGAKSEIHRLMNDLAAQGKGIIMISSELPEVLRMSHRIVVMCEGHITGELPGGSTQEEIMTLATQRMVTVT
jgi:ribose transport system ATP-binding protein